MADGGITADLLAKACKRTHAEMMEEEQVTPHDQPIGGDLSAVSVLTPGQNKLCEELKRLKLSPPKSEAWDELPTEESITQSITADGFAVELQEDETKRLLFFLYIRKFFSDNTERRKNDIKIILKGEPPKRRLQTIIQHEGDNDHPGDDAFKRRCDSWRDLVAEYGTPKMATTVFSQVNQVKLVHRVQTSSNCFLHAPAVVQGYLVQMGTTQWGGMMNLAKFVRNNFSSEQLSDYIIKDAGGDAIRILRGILQEGKSAVWIYGTKDVENYLSSVVNVETNEMWRNLIEKGPALVSGLRIEEAFRCFQQEDAENPVIPFFSGKVADHYYDKDGKLCSDSTQGEKKYHAMVLVGMRIVENEWRLLLQNWWFQMQFVEMSVQYFVSSEAELVWVREAQTEIPKAVPKLMATCAETFMEGNGGDVRELRFEQNF